MPLALPMMLYSVIRIVAETGLLQGANLEVIQATVLAVSLDQVVAGNPAAVLQMERLEALRLLVTDLELQAGRQQETERRLQVTGLQAELQTGRQVELTVWMVRLL